ncbi:MULTISPECIES: hypothetical protein [unclassified Streptomyces]|uniref:hypothetical protein n=1 Tax=unclassified Streptomyces TaxID=2593676 RepID=UPI0036AF4217
MWKVTLRTVTMPIPSQQVITRDNCATCRSSPRSPRRRTPPSSSPPSSWRAPAP